MDYRNVIKISSGDLLERFELNVGNICRDNKFDELRCVLCENEFPSIRVPKIFDDFCSESVLTMEFLEGDDFEKTLSYSQKDKDFLGQLLFDSYIYSLFKKRKIHSDPQNGNYFFSNK